MKNGAPKRTPAGKLHAPCVGMPLSPRCANVHASHVTTLYLATVERNSLNGQVAASRLTIHIYEC